MAGNKLSFRQLLVAPVLLALAACGGSKEEAVSQEAAGMATINGEVFYRERMMLPPGAEVEVQLQDVSRADALATIMASVMFTPEGGPPYAFTIEYSPADIDERMRYSLRATITVDDKLMFTSTEYIDPFSGEDIRIMLQRVPESVDRSPVAAPDPGVEQAEESGVETGGGASAGSDESPVWVLDTLAGEAAPAGVGGRPVELVLDASENKVAGFSGCNRYTGSFSSDGKSHHGTPIQFGLMASTMMACAGDDTAERAYLKMLGTVDAYRMQGSTLALLQGSEVVATFKMR